ncbi:hypothetical protein EVAR_68333_1 [Eumeta japonica]|uniref:Uncharacterized protein n=1 Tax=Eumeta variegata TaxID=151549 RepID=A0A4C1SRD1_EUMVA|nr:hypothetical protein EVAR_68333_1 [Eumeta japonica]
MKESSLMLVSALSGREAPFPLELQENALWLKTRMNMQVMYPSSCLISMPKKDQHWHQDRYWNSRTWIGLVDGTRICIDNGTMIGSRINSKNG